MTLHTIIFALLLTAGLAVGVYTTGPETVMDEARSIIGIEETAPAFVRPPVAAEEIPQVAPVNPASVPVEQPVEQAAPEVEPQAAPVEPEAVPVEPQGGHYIPENPPQGIDCYKIPYDGPSYTPPAHIIDDYLFEWTWNGIRGGIVYYKHQDYVDLTLSYGPARVGSTQVTEHCMRVFPADGYSYDPAHTCVLSPLDDFGQFAVKIGNDVYYLTSGSDDYGFAEYGLAIRAASEYEKCPGEES